MRKVTRIKIKRLEKGIPQTELAQKLGIGLNLMSYFESGRAIPPKDLLEKMAEILGCSPEELAQERSNEDD